LETVLISHLAVLPGYKPSIDPYFSPLSGYCVGGGARFRCQPQMAPVVGQKQRRENVLPINIV